MEFPKAFRPERGRGVQNEEGKSKLPDLPPSDDKFWKGARKYQTKLVKRPACEHYFEYREALKIECKKCHIGFFLSGKERLINGQIVI